VEQALREAEEQFRSLFFSTPLPALLWTVFSQKAVPGMRRLLRRHDFHLAT
jgi:hypothetical protein